MQGYADYVGSAGASATAPSLFAASATSAASAAESSTTPAGTSASYLGDLPSLSARVPAPAPSAVESSYLEGGDGEVTFVSTPDALSSYFEADSSISTETKTTINDDGTITIQRITTVIIEDEEDERIRE